MTRLLFLPFLLTACAAPDRSDVKIIGHGGSGLEGEHPMNSRMALITGLELGLDGVELDVQLTADSVLVAYHPEDLDELTDCTGKINAHTWEEIYPCPYEKLIEPYHIVRLDSLLNEAAARFPKADFTLDCKLFAAGDWWPYLETFSSALAQLAEQPGLKGRMLVECQVVDFLQLVKNKQGSTPVFLYATSCKAGTDTAAARGFDGITIDNKLITAEQVTTAKKRGLDVTIFGVGGALGHSDALGKHPDRLQTDAPSDFSK